MLKYLIALIVIVAAWLTWWLMQTLPLWAPIAITSVAVLVVFAIWLFGRIRAAKAARDLENALSEQASFQAQNARPDLQPQLEEIQAEFDKAVGALKSSKLGHGRRDALYVLPWYLIIGPSGCGKTTAILNSDLQLPHVPAQGERAIRGIGGTRQCDWWFTNEGILLDTAGRWSTEDQDREEWLGFLGFLKKYRKRKPLNGIIASVSIAELAEWSPEQIAQTASKVRARVDEAMSELQMSLPVYVVFMKCDLISGFMETFGGLTKEERSVVWGFTEPLDQKADIATRFEDGFGELVRSLESLTMRRLDEDRRLEVRHKVFGLPQQLAGLKPRLAEFVGQLFEENVFSETPMMRGVYFVSGTQGEGRPFDRVLQGLADGYGLAALPENEYVGETKGYFLRDLFRKVIFSDRNLALRSEGERKRQRWLYYASVASVFLLAGVLLTVPAASCVSNRGLVTRIEEASTELAADVQRNKGKPLPPSAYAALVEEINTLALYEEEGAPVRMSAGLYPGDDLVAPTYEFFGEVFEQNVLTSIYEDDLAHLAEFGRTYAARPNDIPSRSEFVRYWERLRRHLLTTGPREDAEPPLEGDLADSLATGIANRWASNAQHATDEKTTTQAFDSARAYATALSANERLGFSRNDEVVEQVRNALSRVSGVDLTIDGLVQRYDRAAPEVSVRRLVGPGAPSIKGSREVRPAFTKKVWDEYIEALFAEGSDELLGEMWVLGEYAAKAAKDALSDPETYRKVVRSRYLERYIDEWREFIRGFKVEPTQGSTGALRMLEDLTRGQPAPLARLFAGIDHNVDLRDEAGFVEHVRDALDQGEGESPYLSEDDVYEAFRGFITFGVAEEPEEGQAPLPTGLDAYQEQLLYLREAVHAQRGNPIQSSLAQDLRMTLARAKGLVTSQEIGWRPAFESILLPPILYAALDDRIQQALVAAHAWCGSVRMPFDETVRGRFPFQANGQDVPLADFGAFYRPNDGVLWSFYSQYLKDAIPRHGDKFSPSAGIGPGAGQVFRSSLLQFLSGSWEVSSSLFAAGSPDPRVDFEVRIRPSPTIAEQVLSIGGRSIEYFNAPEQWVRMSWPGEDPAAGAALEVRGAGGMREVITQEGDWGFFRLLASGRARQSGSTFTVTWQLQSHGVDVQMDFRPRGSSPFFQPTLLGLFRGAELMAPAEIVTGHTVCSQ